MQQGWTMDRVFVEMNMMEPSAGRIPARRTPAAPVEPKCSDCCRSWSSRCCSAHGRARRNSAATPSFRMMHRSSSRTRWCDFRRLYPRPSAVLRHATAPRFLRRPCRHRSQLHDSGLRHVPGNGHLRRREHQRDLLDEALELFRRDRSGRLPDSRGSGSRRPRRALRVPGFGAHRADQRARRLGLPGGSVPASLHHSATQRDTLPLRELDAGSRHNPCSGRGMRQLGRTGRRQGSRQPAWWGGLITSFE